MAQQAFERGADRAKGLHHTHPLKLKLALDQARFLYYLIGDSESKNDAKLIVSDALQSAEEEFDSIIDMHYKDAVDLIM